MKVDEKWIKQTYNVNKADVEQIHIACKPYSAHGMVCGWAADIRTRSQCTYGCKTDIKRKKNLAIRLKTLCIFFVRNVYALSVECPPPAISSVQIVLSCTKLCERMNCPSCAV